MRKGPQACLPSGLRKAGDFEALHDGEANREAGESGEHDGTGRGGMSGYENKSVPNCDAAGWLSAAFDFASGSP